MPGDISFQFVADQLAIDFVNTEVMADGARVDLLNSFESLVEWLAQAQALGERSSVSLLRRFADKKLRKAALDAARQLRGAIRLLAENAAAGKDIPPASLGEINRVLRSSCVRQGVVRTSTGFALHNLAERNTPIQLLAPVAESAADLLVHGDLHLIKKCENPECILYIYDETKNHTRRWCSMATCGNRSKVKAFRQRVREHT